MISHAALQDFKKVWEAEFGAEPSDEVAMEQAANLLTFMNAIYHPIKQEWLEEFLAKNPEHQNDYEINKGHSQ